MNIQALIRELNELDESTRIEAKAASEVGKSIMETVSAFSNEPGMGGGHLLLGVSRDEQALFPAYVVTGVANPDQIMNDLASQCRSMLNVPVRPVMEREEINGRIVVGAFIPEAVPEHKPVYIASRGLSKGAYRRIGASDQRCTDADLAALFQERSPRGYDSTLLPDVGIEDLSREALENYRRERRARSPQAPELEWDDAALMRGLRVAREDERGVLRLTVAGLLLFGKPVAIRDYFPVARVDYIRLPGRVWIENPAERYTNLDLFGPIFEVVYRAEAAIMDDLPVAFSLPEGSLHRVDKPLIPRDVIREALVNALMHRDYRANRPVQIRRYSNRIEFDNAGFSLKPEEELGQPGSELRNPALAEVLHQTRLAETKGSGIATMKRLMHEADLTQPTFVSDRQSNKFVATLLLHHFLSPENLARLARFDYLGLSREERQALAYAIETERITNADYRNINNVDTLTASAALRHLRDHGLLDAHDKGAATFYTPTAEVLSPEQASGRAAEPQAHGSSEMTHVELEKAHDELGKVHAGTPDTSVIPGEGQEFAEKRQELGEQGQELEEKKQELPPDLRRELSDLRSWATQRELRNLILRLCQVSSWTAEELAALTGRKQEYLVRKHLTPMVQRRQLTRTRPTAHDPYQAYRALQSDDEQ